MKKKVGISLGVVVVIVLLGIILLNPKYTVTFDTKMGTSIRAVEVKKNKPVAKPADPIMTGYQFKGWTLEGEDYDFSKPVTKNITLVAKWEKVN